MSLSCCFKIGKRKFSVLEVMQNTFEENLKNDSDVQIWAKAIKSDPIIQITSKIAKRTNSAIYFALLSAEQAANAALFPITYPLSKITRKREFRLTKCPFPASPPVTISGSGDMILRKNNIFEKIQLSLKNIQNDFESSPSFILRNGYKLTKFVVTLPFKLRIADASKENIALSLIDHYFPTFQAPVFCEWMEKSFLPVALSYYLTGRTTQMKEVADHGIVQERQVQVANIIIQGHLIKSRVLDVSNVSIIDYDFRNNLPTISLKCSVDYVDHIVDKTGKTVSGAPDNIKRSDVYVQMIINTTESTLPKWKAYEIRFANAYNRI